MLNFETWVVFISASLALAFAPGPGMLYVLSRTLSGGTSVGVASTLGAASGGLIHVFAAAIGVSAVLASSATAFMVVKYLGAAFLVYLGLKMIYSASKQLGEVIPVSSDESTNESAQEKAERNKSEIKPAFYQGIVSEVLNPKTAVFFLAFIPQFITPEAGGVFSQFLVLGVVVVLLNTIPDFLIAFFSKPIEKLWKSNQKFRIGQQLVSGVCLLGLGAYLAASGTKLEAPSTAS